MNKCKIEIAHNPELTKEKLLDIFSQEYNDVYMTKLIGVDFFVKESEMSGVLVTLKQKNGKTEISLIKNAPSFWLRTILFGLLPIIFAGDELMMNVKSFIETNEVFKQKK